MLRTLLLCLLVGLAGHAHAADLFRGMTEQEIIDAIGPPNSEIGRTSKKVLMYTGGSLELRLGRLNTADGFDMDYMAPDGVSQFVYMTGQGWTLNGEPVPANYRFSIDDHIVMDDEPAEDVSVISTSDISLPEPDESPTEDVVTETIVEQVSTPETMADQDSEDEYYDEYYDENYEYEPLADFELEPADKTFSFAFWSLTALVFLSVIASFIVAR
ncbi:hypothetical protein [Cerasicoccus fimbriatus]|uniref:hypothetical protein n=1 Tax=Cerasicoccus fimbriatus TaxID=3014554 RepID=UPI0022B38F2A|nr:hypothetical protein [Cerasicoccus sp. TK19100]